MNATDDLVLHMHGVQSAERDLRELGMLWQMIESSASISCPEEVAPILPTLVSTRERFNDLQVRLIARMVAEQRAALGDELTAAAQCAIDILVRNLYERTADVGFLATDDVVRAFCASPSDERAAQRPAMVGRLREYQSKYTVYDDVILLSAEGEVLARLDDRDERAHSCDPIIRESLAANAYVERFGPSDLAEGGGPALLYGHRISNTAGRAIGVLVLRFRFADEMDRIFHAGDAEAPPEVALVLIDAQGRVIATNDAGHVPIGVRLPSVGSQSVARTSFAGRDYLAVACASRGYQGYAGPAWRAQAMVSLLTAFRQRDDAEAPPDNIPLDSPELIAIDGEAQLINRDLRQAVWNGRLMAGAEQGDALRLKAVLSQVNAAGMRTRGRVDRAIKDLYGSSISRTRVQAAQLAQLAAELMDRNLYERANDCRWWALSPALQRLLASADDPGSRTALNGLLNHVNGLYTVYSRLIAFDLQGVIQGVSRSDEAPSLIGSTVDARWLDSVRALRDSQQYAVTPFEATSTHDHGATYVYLSAVRDTANGNRPLGGLAIVFHAAREFQAMLDEILGERDGFAAFVDASGQVLASSGRHAIDWHLLDSSEGSRVLEHGSAHYACARLRAVGYREFKKADGYDNGVSAVIGLRLGSTERRRSALVDRPIVPKAVKDRSKALEVAIFQVGAMRCALPAAALLEAVSPAGVVRTPSSDAAMVGLLETQTRHGRQLVPVVCARRLFGVTHKARATDGIVLVLRSSRHPDVPVVGVRVDDVLSVTEFDSDLLQESPRGFQSFAPWVCGLMPMEVSDGQARQSVLVQLIDVAWLTARGGSVERAADVTAETRALTAVG